jgi:hypothetical protein
VEDEVVVVLRNPGEFRVGTEFFFESFDGTGACVAGAEDDDLRAHAKLSVRIG